MSSEEYWDGDPSLAQYFLRHYRAVQKAEFEEQNFNLWLQGFYNYEGIMSALSHLYGKQPQDYMEKPINFFETEEEKRERWKKEQLERLDRMFERL